MSKSRQICQPDNGIVADCNPAYYDLPMIKERLDRNFGLILHDVARLLRIDFDRRVRDLGLTRSQWWVLTHLFRQDGLTQTELADLMEIQKASVGRLLDRLEEKHWIRRRSDPSDRRVNRVFLTTEVEPVVDEMRRRAALVRSDALAGLSQAQQEEFVNILLHIRGNLAGNNSRADSGLDAEHKLLPPDTPRTRQPPLATVDRPQNVTLHPGILSER